MKQRVPKGEKYWYIGTDWRGIIVVYSTRDVNMVEDRNRFKDHNYFVTKKEALSMTKKLRAVLAGADVIETPSEEEMEIEANKIAEEIAGGPMSGCFRIAVKMTVEWLKSKIVK